MNVLSETDLKGNRERNRIWSSSVAGFHHTVVLSVSFPMLLLAPAAVKLILPPSLLLLHHHLLLLLSPLVLPLLPLVPPAALRRAADAPPARCIPVRWWLAACVLAGWPAGRGPPWSQPSRCCWCSRWLCGTSAAWTPEKTGKTEAPACGRRGTGWRATKPLAATISRTGSSGSRGSISHRLGGGPPATYSSR